jgi:syntaxin-binding protein 1
LEQDLANGEDAEGRAPQNLLGRLTSLMNDTSVPQKYAEVQRVDKLRLLCLYAATQGMDNSIKALFSQTGVDNATVERILKNAVSLGAGVQGIKKSKDKQKQKTSFVISRYVPKLKQIVEEFLEDGLGEDTFPYIGDAPEGAKGKEVKSLKKSQPAWAKGKEKQETTLSGPRVIVFVIGGVTFSEIRAMGELMEAHHREIIIGSNRLLRPHEFIEDLKALQRS